MIDDEQDLRAGVGKWMAFLDPMLVGIDTHRWAGQDQDRLWDLLRRGGVASLGEFGLGRGLLALGVGFRAA
jgi:hypothetical protein